MLVGCKDGKKKSQHGEADNMKHHEVHDVEAGVYLDLYK